MTGQRDVRKISLASLFKFKQPKLRLGDQIDISFGNDSGSGHGVERLVTSWF